MDRKKLHIKTFGCQMNVYDSERMAEALAADGYEETARQEDADLIVLNTCHIREKAVEKVYSDLGRIRDIKTARAAAGLDTVIAVAGCVAQAEGQEIMRRAPAVDVVIGPRSYHRLPALLGERGARSSGVVETSFPEEDKFVKLPERGAPRAATAFLAVQEGCDKFCTFCVVPYTRGAEASRPMADIVGEARRLVESGVKEITLLGQNVNAYHGLDEQGGTASLARLIRALARTEGLARIRYTTSHPRDMTDDLIAAHRDQEKLMPYLHLPFQAGSDRVLAAMNRRHTAREYIDLIGRIRAARPDIALSTDIIVGFPGETEDDFRATLDMIDEIGFAHAYAFKYSARPGTPAARMDGQVSEPVKSERLARLGEALSRAQQAFNAGFVGKRAPVLFERMGKRPEELVGRSPHLQPVTANGAVHLIGRIVDVAISGAGPNSLSGVIDLG